MKNLSRGSIALVAVAFAGQVLAADSNPLEAVTNAAAWSWTGFYFGGQVGGTAGQSTYSDPFGTSIYGDKVTTPGFSFGADVGYNFQVDKWVFGVEADANWLISDGTNTCFAYSGTYVSSSCHSKPDAFGTLTGRIGYAAGAAGHTLLYGKGGAAWVHNNSEMNVNNLYYGFVPQPAPTSLSNTKLGWTIGAGVEQALTPAWSLKFEYDYLGFAGSNIATGPSVIYPPLGFPAGSITSMTESFHVMKLGLNYRIGGDPKAQWGSASPSFPVKATPGLAWAPGWEFEGGVRYWYSSGKFQWDNAQSIDAPQIMQSRLTYAGLKANSGELYGRIDSPMRLFLKGNAGLGRIFDGVMNDEDWGILGFVSYTNTLSPGAQNGPISYGTVDAGYDFLAGPGYKAGAFVGYNRYNQKTSTYGCVQIANPLFPCLAPGDNRLVGTQDTHWDSFRVGASGEVMLLDRLKLSGEVAYLPYTKFVGRDDHLLRTNPTWFDHQGTGQGVQLESILSYLVTNNFNIGVGARYWAMWTNSGTFTCTGCGAVGVTIGPDAGKFNTERYGLFVQAGYKY